MGSCQLHRNRYVYLIHSVLVPWLIDGEAYEAISDMMLGKLCLIFRGLEVHNRRTPPDVRTVANNKNGAKWSTEFQTVNVTDRATATMDRDATVQLNSHMTTANCLEVRWIAGNFVFLGAAKVLIFSQSQCVRHVFSFP